ncbi:hypothetical protein ANAPRD1_01182 [Anaplasma phagocytophilum]|nr:hypothetical protein ANAPRD1_01182 [Anaplasma phagocytophilum]
MSMIYKGKGDKSDIMNYRPMTVTQVIYRLVMRITKKQPGGTGGLTGHTGRVTELVSEKKKVGGQYVFSYTVYRNSAKRKTVSSGSPFLDTKGAYDNVNQKDLWDVVESLNLDEGLTRTNKEHLQR